TPNRLADGCVVGVHEQSRAEVRILGVAGEVDFHQRGGGKAIDVGSGIDADVRGAHEDVVHVEQQAASGAPGELGEEADLVPLVTIHLQVVRWVLDRDAAAERVLRGGDVR